MEATNKVIKNSFWLIIQPLILNFISIFVTGYIARELGQSEYGRFVFAFSFVALFSPLANLGLRMVTVRHISETRDTFNNFLGKMLSLRLVLSFAGIAILGLMLNLMGYPQGTKSIVYIASLTIIFQAVESTFADCFLANEKMKYVAYARFFSGITLTIFSVVVLILGYRLRGLVLVYSLGNLLGAVVAGWLFFLNFKPIHVSFDFNFAKENLKKGAPFFLPAFIALMGTKMGIVFLSKMAGDGNVGVYGAANNLIERLMIIPDAVCTAIFPTMVAVFLKSKDKAKALFKRFFLLLLMIGMPLMVGLITLSEEIVLLIYGNKFMGAAFVLQILACWLFLNFIISIQGWALGAIHKEKEAARVIFISTSLYVLLNFILVPSWQEKGAAMSLVISAVLSFLLFRNMIRKFFHTNLISFGALGKIVLANFLMMIILIVVKKINLFLSIFSAVTIYAFLMVFLRIVTKTELGKLFNLIVRKRGYDNE